jgi:hypothetical protein
MLIPAVLALLPGIAYAAIQGGHDDLPEPSRHRVELKILDEPARILEQVKGSVCGNGPYYAGNVDDPVYVTPLFHTNCTIAPTAPGQR